MCEPLSCALRVVMQCFMAVVLFRVCVWGLILNTLVICIILVVESQPNPLQCMNICFNSGSSKVPKSCMTTPVDSFEQVRC